VARSSGVGFDLELRYDAKTRCFWNFAAHVWHQLRIVLRFLSPLVDYFALDLVRTVRTEIFGRVDRALPESCHVDITKGFEALATQEGFHFFFIHPSGE
jgi:hypothetical protein